VTRKAEPDLPEGQSAVPFEEAIRRLGEIVERLEAGDLTLEESLQAFERGVALARDAQKRLAAAEARVEELVSVDEHGRPVTRPIPAGAEPPTARRGGA
jgi:exodeoxyribonuclease VII small subunit